MVGTVFAAQGVAGFLHRVLGAPLLVLANVFTYLYAGVSELFPRIPRLPRMSDREGLHPLRRFQVDFIEGWNYLKANPVLLTLIMVYALLNFLISPLLVVLPFFVQDYLGLPAEVSAGVMPLGMALGGLLFDLSGKNVPLLLGGQRNPDLPNLGGQTGGEGLPRLSRLRSGYITIPFRRMVSAYQRPLSLIVRFWVE